MRDEPSTGPKPRTHADATTSKKPTPCEACGRPAAGYDARRDRPSCRRCARIRADGGTSPEPGQPAAYLPDDATVVLRELNDFRRDLLAATALYEPDTPRHDDPYGVGLKGALEAVYDKPVLPGQLYPGLSDLVDHDLLRVRVRDGRANYYGFTERGQRALAGYAYFLTCAAARAGGDVTWTHQFSPDPAQALESFERPRLPPAPDRDRSDREGER
jgi:DNA-binding PadR family transcriptional regulator